MATEEIARELAYRTTTIQVVFAGFRSLERCRCRGDSTLGGVNGMDAPTQRHGCAKVESATSTT